jgi:hypothetical protein
VTKNYPGRGEQRQQSKSKETEASMQVPRGTRPPDTGGRFQHFSSLFRRGWITAASRFTEKPAAEYLLDIPLL